MKPYPRGDLEGLKVENQPSVDYTDIIIMSDKRGILVHHSKDNITRWPRCHKCHAVRTKISHFQGLVNRLEVSNIEKHWPRLSGKKLIAL